MTSGNRLAREKNPYLRQHAGDPVDWHPWGEEAFERARHEDKPVFLSIGYAACHWCHVMARESFADRETADLINAGFVAIKVDREERPDLDRHYMAVCQSLIGTAGWPLTILMTPDKRPFYAGTYIPKSRRWGRPGLMEILSRVAEIWQIQRADILAAADRVAAGAGQAAPGERGRRAEKLTAAVLDETFRELAADFDRDQGGFGGAPKFPVAHPIAFLLRYWQRTGNGEALGMAGKTLKAMRRGGIYDHLGFGFHRYATDAGWLVPHFEKMLPDQALLAEVYAEAYAATGRNEFKRTAAEVAEYVLRDLAAPDGGFFTAEDADSEGEEGRFYLWTREELEQALGPEDAELAALAFRVGEEGDAAEGLWDGRNVLHEGRVPEEKIPVPAGARRSGEQRLEGIRRRLLEARGRRPRPFRDTKVLADWNGLMIAALAAVFRITGEGRYLRAAAAAADFVLKRMRGAGGRLLHAFAEGEARVPAFLDDHAFLIKGLTALYEAGGEPRFLEAALDLADRAMALFWDAGAAGFFYTAEGGELPRRKEIADGALPSGNSVMFRDLLRLARLTGRPDLEEQAAHFAAAFASEVASHPRLYTEFLCGLDHALGPAREVVVAGKSDAPETSELLCLLRGSCFRNTALLFKPTDDSERAAALERLAPFTKGLDAGAGPVAAYVCSEGACLRPATSSKELLETLSAPPPSTSGRPRTRR